MTRNDRRNVQVCCEKLKHYITITIASASEKSQPSTQLHAATTIAEKEQHDDDAGC